MKATRLSAALPAIAAACVALISTICQARESGFLQSPDGKLVASISHISRELPVPTEGMSLRQTLALKVRAMDGKDVWGFTIKAAKEPYQISYGEVDLAWSPDSRRVAFRNGGDLAVVDISSKERKEVSHAASSFRWLDSSQIVYLSGKTSVVRVSVATGVSESLFRADVRDEFHPSTSPYHNQISPDCRLFVYMDGNNINVVDLRKKVVVGSVGRELKPVFCWWNDRSDLCLIDGLVKVRTGKAWPEDIEFREVLYLFRQGSGKFEEVTSELRSLNGNHLNTPRPDAPFRVWLSDETSFLIFGPVERKNRKSGEAGSITTKNWICHPAPWSALCVQDFGGQEFEAPSISPRGDYLMMNKAAREAYRDGDWYVFKFSADPQGKPELTKPVRVLPSNSGNWFWSSDGKSVITFKQGKFIVQKLP